MERIASGRGDIFLEDTCRIRRIPALYHHKRGGLAYHWALLVWGLWQGKVWGRIAALCPEQLYTFGIGSIGWFFKKPMPIGHLP